MTKLLQANPALQWYHTKVDSAYPIYDDLSSYIGKFVQFEFDKTINPMLSKASKIVNVFNQQKQILITDCGSLLRPVSAYQFKVIELHNAIAKTFNDTHKDANLLFSVSDIPQQVWSAIVNHHYFEKPFVRRLFTQSNEIGHFVFVEFTADSNQIVQTRPLCSVEKFLSVTDSFRNKKHWRRIDTTEAVTSIKDLLNTNISYEAAFRKKQIYYDISR